MFSPLTDPEELLLIDGLDEPMERLRLKIGYEYDFGYDSINYQPAYPAPPKLASCKSYLRQYVSSYKRETLLAVESLLAMNGIAITKINEKFYKAVPAQGATVHVPIWLDVPASSLRPSQRIYMKLFRLNYAPALEVRATECVCNPQC